MAKKSTAWSIVCKIAVYIYLNHRGDIPKIWDFLQKQLPNRERYKALGLRKKDKDDGILDYANRFQKELFAERQAHARTRKQLAATRRQLGELKTNPRGEKERPKSIVLRRGRAKKKPS
jgi:hypothetical protein